MAKVNHQAVRAAAEAAQRARIILVSAINPTPAGEGKTTVSIGLSQGLKRRGRRVAAALREPSLGPIFGMKGGGTGGGKAKLEPSARINMHFTGDLHAITAAHNLLAALVDNVIQFGIEPAPDSRTVTWKRCLDMNERALRKIIIGLGGKSEGQPRETGFDITAASEVMAILCLARDIADLKARLGRILVGYDRKGGPIVAGQIKGVSAMAALLQDAILPNLVQTFEGVPTLVHGGPFGNIAHGCNSVIATRTAAALADYVVTEAGFGFDLGAEKFLDIKCRSAGIWPRAVVLVATARALRMHGGEKETAPLTGTAALAALEKGLGNLEKHVESVRAYGLDPVVAVNTFPKDTDEEHALIEKACKGWGLASARFRGFTDGGAGAEALAEAVENAADRAPQPPKYVYELDQPVEDKIRAIARTIYGAKDVAFTKDAVKDIEKAVKLGYGGLPICMAKTHLSLSDNAAVVGRPRDFELTVRQLRISAGAGYLLALTGEIMTMPGLPKEPAAGNIELGEDGEVTGIT
jgi:formate--tetrahydrofolate ligase